MTPDEDMRLLLEIADGYITDVRTWLEKQQRKHPKNEQYTFQLERLQLAKTALRLIRETYETYHSN